MALLSACFIGAPLGLVAVSYQLGFGEGIASEQAARVSAQEQEAIDRAESLYLSTAPVLLTLWMSITAGGIIELQRFFPDTLAF